MLHFMIVMDLCLLYEAWASTCISGRCDCCTKLDVEAVDQQHHDECEPVRAAVYACRGTDNDDDYQNANVWACVRRRLWAVLQYSTRRYIGRNNTLQHIQGNQYTAAIKQPSVMSSCASRGSTDGSDEVEIVMTRNTFNREIDQKVIFYALSSYR